MAAVTHDQPQGERAVLKHALATRWFHWVNFPVLSLMIWSGLLIYWANRVYHIDIGPWSFHFFPEGFNKTFKLEARLAEGMAWHFLIMWLFMINGILYVLYTVISGEWRLLVPGKGAVKEAIQVVLYDLKLTKKHPPVKKFNAAQQFAYTSVIIMGVFSTLTGLAIYKPVQLGFLLALLGGYETARLIHFVLTLSYVAFFFVHVGQVIRAGWNNFRAMLTGYELVTEGQGQHE